MEQSGLVRYNRIEGLFAGLEFPKLIGDKISMFQTYGFFGYGFAQKRFQYKLGLNRWFFSRIDYRLEIGAAAFDYTNTKDRWLISPTENSLLAFFIHEDFYDYYRKSGFEIYLNQNISRFFRASIAYRNRKHMDEKKNIDWALFGCDKKFTENPLINEGNMRTVYGEIYLDTRDNKELPKDGWYAKFSYETAAYDLSSDFSFSQYLFELRRYQRLSPHERIDVRLKAGSAQGNLPFQKSYEIGGISTMRGFGIKELSSSQFMNDIKIGCDRMLLANFEYNISPRIIRSNLFFFDDVRYIFFFDAGAVWHRKDVSEDDIWYKGFSHLTFNDISSDFGIALSSWSGKLRLNIAKRLDTSKDAVTVTVRLTKPF